MLSKPPWIARFGMITTGAACVVTPFVIAALNNNFGPKGMPFWPQGAAAVASVIVGIALTLGALEDKM